MHTPQTSTSTTPDQSPDAAMSVDRRLLLGAAGLAGIAALASHRAGAGPLTPPAGPVTGTAKPLGEVEPRTAVNSVNTPGTNECIFRLSQPGSYYLTGNVNVPAGRRGIEITASGVTLDLNGFALLGSPGSGEGVLCFVLSVSGITLRNGHVSGFGNAGVNLQQANADNCRVEHLTVSSCGAGILIHANSTVTGCVVNSNSGPGISGIAYNSIDRCVVRGNAGTGIAAGNAARITDCTVSESGGVGIISFILGHISGCSCLNNAGDGLLIGERNRVVGNLFFGNGAGPGSGAGLHAAVGTGLNHIEANTALSNDRGYHIESVRNLLIRNAAADNPTRNWEVAGGNSALIVFAALCPAVNGNSGGTPLAPASYDPNANFTYQT